MSKVAGANKCHRTGTPEKVYRHQLKPVISTSAIATSTILGNKKSA
jgi:hypothetical protein